ncbi:hypothetical protein ACH4F6_33970 [Streptomyces sp. NPDC017936]|uniref:hypothetical protein n=1 Tax=Streptomyces sp. NPDC017936 TaxID=3365016 RepID=UPI0037A5DFFC
MKMDTDGHITGGERVQDEQNDLDVALTELRRRLSDGLARSGLEKTPLARRTGLVRMPMSAVFQSDGPVPSARTVAALAHRLHLPGEELLEQR